MSNIFNNARRQSITLDAKAHRRIKILAAEQSKLIGEILDEAVFMYLKTQVNPALMMRAQDSE